MAVIAVESAARYGWSACARFGSGMDCSQIWPGPVSATRWNPSLPNSLLAMPGTWVMLNRTCAWNIPT